MAGGQARRGRENPDAVFHGKFNRDNYRKAWHGMEKQAQGPDWKRH